MRNKMLLLVVFLLLAANLGAQSHPAFAPYATVDVSTTSALGTGNPDYAAGVGIESNTKRFLVDANIRFSTADPAALTVAGIKNGTGYATRERAEIYYKLFGSVLVGVGANAYLQPTALVSVLRGERVSIVRQIRAAAHPFIGGGVQLGRVRIIADYQLPGIEALPNERQFDVNAEVQIAKRIRLTGAASLMSYFNGASPSPGVFITPVPYTQGNVRVTGTRVGAGLKFLL